MIQLIFLLLAQLSYASIDEVWKPNSDPMLMGRNFETRFHLLPATGQIKDKTKFWSGDYWPLNKGSINQRWFASSISHLSPDKDQLTKISQAEIAQLSPSEKFDLLNGRYDYPLRNEVEKTVNYNAKKWEGICHGWAPASMNHNEPTGKLLKNPDGVTIPFGSSDIKALLSYFYAHPYQVADTHQMGRRCNRDMMNFSQDCKQDLNAGAFHIVLANKVGLTGESFIADMDRYKEIWNHPIYAYETSISDDGGPKYHSAPGTERTVKVKTTVSFVYASKNSWAPLIGTEHQVIKKQEFKYVLDLDANGMIIGGYWKSLERPDFLWIKERPKKFEGAYQRLAELLND